MLGPTLFILFINDMEKRFQHSSVRLIADDTGVSKQISCEHYVKLLKDDLYNIIDWSNSNSMMLHEDKFELIIHKHTLKSTIYELPFVSESMTYKV